MGKRGRRKGYEKQAPVRQRRSLTPIWIVVGLVGVMVAFFLGRGSGGGGGGEGGGSAASIAKVTSVPAAVLDTIGASPVTNASNVKLIPAGQPPIEENGLPVVTYVGAEYCPFCAAERWPMIVALSRFGTFTGLSTTVSAARPEVFPETPTLTFHDTSYASDYLVLSAVETATNNPSVNGGYTPLDTPTAQQQRLLDIYDTQQFAGSDGGIPFIMIGNRYVWVGATYDPGALRNLTFDQIANRLADPEQDVAKAIGGSANLITAMICTLTGDQPGDVCGAAGVVAAKALLPTA